MFPRTRARRVHKRTVGCQGCDRFLVRCIVPSPEKAIEEAHWRMMYDDAHANWDTATTSWARPTGQ